MTTTELKTIPDLLGFAQSIMAAWPEGGIDGADLQDIAVRHGVLEAFSPLAPCGDACLCAEVYGKEQFEAGMVECYRLTIGNREQ